MALPALVGPCFAVEVALPAPVEPRLATAGPSFLTVPFFLDLRNPLPLSCQAHVVRRQCHAVKGTNVFPPLAPSAISSVVIFEEDARNNLVQVMVMEVHLSTPNQSQSGIDILLVDT